MSLYDYGLGTLAQYELTADRSARTRGALLCYTAQGLLILREFHGSEKKLEKQQELLMRLQENGINTDFFCGIIRKVWSVKIRLNKGLHSSTGMKEKSVTQNPGKIF